LRHLTQCAHFFIHLVLGKQGNKKVSVFTAQKTGSIMNIIPKSLSDVTRSVVKATELNPWSAPIHQLHVNLDPNTRNLGVRHSKGFTRNDSGAVVWFEDNKYPPKAFFKTPIYGNYSPQELSPTFTQKARYLPTQLKHLMGQLGKWLALPALLGGTLFSAVDMPFRQAVETRLNPRGQTVYVHNLPNGAQVALSEKLGNCTVSTHDDYTSRITCVSGDEFRVTRQPASISGRFSEARGFLGKLQSLLPQSQTHIHHKFATKQTFNNSGLYTQSVLRSNIGALTSWFTFD
jgi:hypothetical protein